MLEGNDHVDAPGELVALRGVSEHPASVEGLVVTQLWTDQQVVVRLDVHADGDRAEGNAATRAGEMELQRTPALR